jgi:hypothetical protein
LMMSVHSNLVQSHQYALLQTTSHSQRHCITRQQRMPWPWLRPGCRDDVTWIC